MKIIKTDFEDIEAFLYTSEGNNRLLAVDQGINQTRITEIEEEAKEKTAYIWKN